MRDIKVTEEMVQGSISDIEKRIKEFQETNDLCKRPASAHRILYEASILLEYVCTMRGQKVPF